MSRLFTLLFALGVLCLVPMICAGAQALPPELAARIGAAAEQGRSHQESLSDVIDERRKIANRQLETVVVSAIAERPELFKAIMREAYLQAPESHANLYFTVTDMFPGFVGVLPDLSGTPPRQTKRETPQVVVSHDIWTPDSERVGTPGDRPANWPILPKEGGIDRYADKDPLEGLNWVFFYANGAIDFLIFEPLARGYRFMTPEPAQHALSRAFDNLASPIIFANDLLQLRFHHAATTLSRFAINSTGGVLGL
ncbi:MAG: MlaA family lipoprotein, partial [Alphaproteobacteria bacterium]